MPPPLPREARGRPLAGCPWDVTQGGASPWRLEGTTRSGPVSGCVSIRLGPNRPRAVLRVGAWIRARRGDAARRRGGLEQLRDVERGVDRRRSATEVESVHPRPDLDTRAHRGSTHSRRSATAAHTERTGLALGERRPPERQRRLPAVRVVAPCAARGGTDGARRSALAELRAVLTAQGVEDVEGWLANTRAQL